MEPYQVFEQKWAEFSDLDPKGMVACSSGTAALHLALEAMQLPRGSTVIVPDYTMVACPRAVVLAGLQPRFVDCVRSDLLIDVQLVQDAVSVNTRAVMAVHVYGRKCDMEGLFKASRKHGTDCRLVEDLAEAHGVHPHPMTDAACWSFYKNKIVAGEEGGAVWFRDPYCASIARSLRSLGFMDAHDFMHLPRGHNYRLSNAHASLILANLANYAENIKARRCAETWYNTQCPAEWCQVNRAAPWVYDVRIQGANLCTIDRCVAALREAGIEARHGFKPMTWQNEFDMYEPVSRNTPTEAAFAANEMLYLPLTSASWQSAPNAFEVLRRCAES